MSLNRLFFTFILMFIFFPSLGNAHTGLVSSTPESGQVVPDDLNEIILTFAGEIESLSTMNLVREGQEISFTSIEPKGKQMIGTLPASLENGSYLVQWSIVGEDGHQIKGEVPFTVQSEEKVNQEPDNKTNKSVPSSKEENEKDNAIESDTAKKESSSNALKIVIPVVTVFILGIGLFMLFGRKR